MLSSRTGATMPSRLRKKRKTLLFLKKKKQKDFRMLG